MWVVFSTLLDGFVSTPQQGPERTNDVSVVRQLSKPLGHECTLLYYAKLEHGLNYRVLC